jgi:hypothetical protein
MSNIKVIPDSDVAPMQPLTPQIINDAFVANVDGVRDLTFGTPPLLVLAHDHGQARGEVLERVVATWNFGPSSDSLTTGNWSNGVPMYPPSGGESFFNTPKLLASCGLLLGGNVGDVTMRIAVDMGTLAIPRSVTVRVELRVYADSGLDAGQGVGRDLTILINALAARYQTATATIAESELREVFGLTGLDRECEVNVWLVADPAVGTTYRLLSLVLSGQTVSQYDASPTSTQILSQIEPIEIQQGRRIVDVLGTKLKRRLNQATFGVLGKIPGMATLTQEDDTRWGRNITAPHQHTGRSEGDGACIRQGTWCAPYCVDYKVVAGQMSSLGVFGLNTTTGGSTINDLTAFEGRASLPKGLGALQLRLAIMPGTFDPSARLRLLVAVDDTMGSTPPLNNFATTVSTPTFPQDATLSLGVFIGCEVNPIDTARWNPVAGRTTGLWTQADLLGTQPVGKSSGAAYRISEPVTIGVDLPSTKDYRIKLFCGIESPVGSGVFDTLTFVQWACIVPAYGY